ncbi:MAG: serine/threonine-protein kinase [Thermoanaerobaculia bacterium]
MPEAAESEAVAALFARAVELPAGERAGFVKGAPVSDAVRREVASLLAVYDSALSQPEGLEPELAAGLLGEGTRGAAQERVGSESGRLLGPYRLLRELGRGGMGVVYLAERADGAYEQRVALKILPPSLRSEVLDRRFVLERRILARLEHPGIARLLDGGVDEEGRPYLVLEYVDGEPLTAWCDARSLGVDGRLELFLQVCDAVQFAHARLVVHRDLKPSNILVDGDGRVKLLDFGIAKLLAEGGDTEATVLTRLGLRPYTPGYAAPEQVRGEPITVGTDVYGLGALLYELLCGLRPLEEGGAARRGRWQWREPERPSARLVDTAARQRRGTSGVVSAVERAACRGGRPDALARRLAGDLDTIALTALREEPGQRYPSVQALADDVRRHRDGLPIAARPAGLAYRARKFVRRHRVGVTAGTLTALALVAGLAGTAWQARVAGREREAARAEAAKAEQVAAFLAGVFSQANPLESKGEEMTVRQALDRGAARIDEDLADQPLVRAELGTVLGSTYLELGDTERAEELVEGALALRREHLAAEDPEIAETLRVLGLVRYRQGDFDGAVASWTDALGIVERSLGPDAPEAAKVLNNLGIVYGRTARYEEGIAAYDRALAIDERRFGPDAVEVAKVSLNLGTLLSARREDERAMAAYERALAIYERVLGPDHPYVAGALGNMAYIRLRREEYDGLEEIVRRMLAIYRKAYGPVHENVGTSLKVLGDLLAATGRADEAAEAYREAVDVNRRASGADHPNVAFPLHDLGRLHLETGPARRRRWRRSRRRSPSGRRRWHRTTPAWRTP